MRTLSAEGYSGCEVRVTHARTEIIIRATHTQEVLGEKGRRIRELTALVQKRFKFPEGSVELYAEKVQNRGLDAIAQCESLRYKLLGGLAVRRSVFSFQGEIIAFFWNRSWRLSTNGVLTSRLVPQSVLRSAAIHHGVGS